MTAIEVEFQSTNLEPFGLESKVIQFRRNGPMRAWRSKPLRRISPDYRSLI
jgi:hypothetical protein